MSEQAVRFRVAWRWYRVGDVIYPPGTLRQWLVEHGFAELVDPPKPKETPKPTPQKRLVRRGRGRC